MNARKLGVSKKITVKVIFFATSLCLFLAYTFLMNRFAGSFNSVFWGSFYNEFFIFLGLWLLAIGLFFAGKKTEVDREAGLILIVALIPLLQWQFGIIYFWGDSVIAFSYLFGAGAALVCARTASKHYSRRAILNAFFAVFVILGLLSFFISLYQFFDLKYAQGFVLQQNTSRVFGHLRQPNNYSSLQFISFFAAWYFFEKRYYSRPVWWVLGTAIVVSIVLAQSRTALLVAFLVGVLFAIFSRSINFRAKYYDIIAYVLAYIALDTLFTFLDQQDHRAMLADDPARYVIWQDAITAILHSPLWGYGWTQVTVAQLSLIEGKAQGLLIGQSHNLFLDILLWNGPILGGSIIFCVCWLSWRALRHCTTVSGWLLLMVLCALFTHAMLEYPLHYAYFLLPAAFAMGLTDRQSHSAAFQVNPLVTGMVLLLAGLLLARIFNDYLALETKEHFLNYKGQGYVIRDDRPINLDRDIVVLTQLREYSKLENISVDEGITEEDLQWLKKLAYRFPTPYTLAEYAKASMYLGEQQEFEQTLRVIDYVFDQPKSSIAKNIIKKYQDANGVVAETEAQGVSTKAVSPSSTASTNP